MFRDEDQMEYISVSPCLFALNRWSSKNNEGMAQYKLFGKDLKEYEDIDIDDLLSKLTPEEIEELGQELIDPDVSNEAACRGDSAI